MTHAIIKVAFKDYDSLDFAWYHIHRQMIVFFIRYVDSVYRYVKALMIYIYKYIYRYVVYSHMWYINYCIFKRDEILLLHHLFNSNVGNLK